MNTQNLRNYKLSLKGVLALLLSAILLTSFLSYLAWSNPDLSYPTVVTEGSMITEASYIVFLDGSTYYARNGLTGAMDYSDTNKTLVLYNVESSVDDAGGIIYLKDITFDNLVELSPSVTVIQDLYGKQTYFPRKVHFEKLSVVENDEFTFQVHVYPKAHYYAGVYRKTYFTYMNSLYSPWRIYIRAFDHDTETWGASYMISTVASADPHMASSIGILPSGKLIVFYGAHSTTPLYYRVSTNAEDESSWEDAQNFPIINMGWTYPQPQSFGEQLVLFARDSMNATNVRWMMKTTEDGSSWSAWSLIQQFPDGQGGYFVFNKIGDKILASGHTAFYGNTTSKNLYFAYSDDQGSTWKEEDDSAISLPIDAEQLIAYTGAETGSTSVYTFPLLDEYGRPFITSSWFDGAIVQHINIAQCSAPLGYGGSWTVEYAQDTDGNDLDIIPSGSMYPALIEGSIEFVQALIPQNKTSIFRRVSGTNFRFEQKYVSETALPQVLSHACCSDSVRDRDFASNPIDWVTQEDEHVYSRSYNRRNYP